MTLCTEDETEATIDARIARTAKASETLPKPDWFGRLGDGSALPRCRAADRRHPQRRQRALATELADYSAIP